MCGVALIIPENPLLRVTGLSLSRRKPKPGCLPEGVHPCYNTVAAVRLFGQYAVIDCTEVAL